ncbi:hypothetical protein E2C01_034155 [Portunus trituberculatus]|uniref:Uncharacterized protein n=1 Tax=Portunus trituberculatus TaxID=210409 RepID=A0A5B7F693_PORTR|nr:hypothetical protein [Portunus trituberculatus]
MTSFRLLHGDYATVALGRACHSHVAWREEGRESGREAWRREGRKGREDDSLTCIRSIKHHHTSRTNNTITNNSHRHPCTLHLAAPTPHLARLPATPCHLVSRRAVA